MKIAAVIAEYNPFHNGHAYQLRLIKEQYGYDFIIIVMSGDFTQRGCPAIVDKYTRTRMALLGGADLVIELPAYYACASAEYFATGAVSLLHGLGCVDALFFGSESEDTDAVSPNPPASLMRAASIALEESAEYRRVLSDALKRGHNYAFARMSALTNAVYTDESSQQRTAPAESSAVLSTPNNALGIEYCKALLRLNSPIKPFAIKRIGSGYHDTDMTGSFASAEAIRALLLQKPSQITLSQDASAPQQVCDDQTPSDTQKASDILQAETILPELRALVPAATAQMLSEQYRTRALVQMDDFSSLLHYRLLLEQSRLEQYADCTPDLANRIQSLLPCLLSQTVTDMIRTIKTKAFTYTRINRVLTHLLLNMTAGNLSIFTDHNMPAFLTYARILGFRKTACGTLLPLVKENARIPLISKPSGYHPSGAAAALYEGTILTSHIYQSAAANNSCSPFRHELTRTPLIL